jgi:3-oxoacyl-(acyl-carrier-protein) synthase/acyl carrier protein
MSTVIEYLASSDLSTDSFTSATSLGDAGLDSLDMLKLASLLSEALYTALPSTILFDYPSVDAFCAYVVAVQGIANAMQVGAAAAGGAGGAASTSAMRRKSSIVPYLPSSRARTYSYGRTAGSMLDPMRRGRTGSFSLQKPVGLTSPRPVGMLDIATAGKRRASLFSHGELRTTVLSGNQSVHAMHVILIEASAVRLPGVNNMARKQLSTLEVDALTRVPSLRWDIEWLGRDSGVSLPARFGGFLQDSLSEFDPVLFRINPSEALFMDPQQRILLECTYEAFQIASHQKFRRNVKDNQVGVYVGASYPEYMQLAATANKDTSTYTASGGSLSVIAGRISYVFGFSGPCALVDTACSSSLVALSGAHNALRLGQCTMAVAGAVNLMLLPNTTAMYHSAGMLTADGRCKTLDAAADGYVRSEAAAATVLRTVGVHDPEASSPDSAIVLLAAAVNQDGKSSSLTAPNGPAQQALIRAALQGAHLAAAEVGTMQLHGTGTALGDPIEVNATLSVLMSKRTAKEGSLVMCAAKAAFGHAEPAAGAVGLTAAALSLENHELPQQMHLRTVNAYVSQSISSFGSAPAPFIARTRAPKLSHTSYQAKPIASVSGFAFQGTNAHAIMQAVHGVSGGEVCAASVFENTGAVLVWRKRVLWAAAPRLGLLKRSLGKVSTGSTTCLKLEALINADVAACINNAVGWSVATEVSSSCTTCD